MGPPLVLPAYIFIYCFLSQISIQTENKFRIRCLANAASNFIEAIGAATVEFSRFATAACRTFNESDSAFLPLPCRISVRLWPSRLQFRCLATAASNSVHWGFNSPPIQTPSQCSVELHWGYDRLPFRRRATAALITRFTNWLNARSLRCLVWHCTDLHDRNAGCPFSSARHWVARVV